MTGTCEKCGTRVRLRRFTNPTSDHRAGQSVIGMHRPPNHTLKQPPCPGVDSLPQPELPFDPDPEPKP